MADFRATRFLLDRGEVDAQRFVLRAQLIEYDPGLAAMCREVFGDTELKYTKPTTRLTGHMAGYDPSTAPKFVWPERLTTAKAEIRKKVDERVKAAEKGPITEPYTK